MQTPLTNASLKQIDEKLLLQSLDFVEVALVLR